VTERSRVAHRVPLLLVLTALLAGSIGATPPTTQADDDPDGRGVGVRVKPPTADGPKRRWAILIALNAYRHWPDLRMCVADAKKLADVLVKHAGFKRERVWLMTMDASSAHDHPYTADAIHHRLTLLLKQTRPNDVVIVYFAGHGDLVGGKSYLVPFDAKRVDNHVLPQQGLPISEVRNLLEDYRICKARHKLLVLDACHSGGERGVVPAMARGFDSPLAAAKTFATISSCTEGQTSLEDEKLGHGVFTHFLVEALSGKADYDKNQSIDLMELYGFVSRKTREYVSKRFNKQQTPKFMGKIVTGFEVAVKGGATASPPDGPDTTPVTTPAELSKTLTLRKPGQLPIEMILVAAAGGPFYISKHEITQEHYRRFCKAKGLPFPEKRYDRSFGVALHPKLPMVHVTHTEAKAFCAYYGLQLPTAAQWVTAAGQMQVSEKNPWRYALPVDDAKLSKTAGGVIGMADNVAEWCAESERCGGGAWSSSPSIDPKTVKIVYSDALGFRPCTMPKTR